MSINLNTQAELTFNFRQKGGEDVLKMLKDIKQQSSTSIAQATAASVKQSKSTISKEENLRRTAQDALEFQRAKKVLDIEKKLANDINKIKLSAHSEYIKQVKINEAQFETAKKLKGISKSELANSYKSLKLLESTGASDGEIKRARDLILSKNRAHNNYTTKVDSLSDESKSIRSAEDKRILAEQTKAEKQKNKDQEKAEKQKNAEEERVKKQVIKDKEKLSKAQSIGATKSLEANYKERESQIAKINTFEDVKDVMRAKARLELEENKLKKERHKLVNIENRLLKKNNITLEEETKLRNAKNRVLSQEGVVYSAQSGVSNANRMHSESKMDRNTQFYNRANMMVTLPTVLATMNSLNALSEREGLMKMFIATYGKDAAKIELEKLYQLQYQSSLDIGQLMKISMIARREANNQNEVGLNTNKDDLTKVLVDALSLSTANSHEITGVLTQFQQVTTQGFVKQTKDLIPILNRMLGMDFDKFYEKVYGKKYTGGDLKMVDITRTLVEFLKSPEAIEAKKFQMQSYQQAEERLKEVTHNLSAELGKLINDTFLLGGKFRTFSDVLDKLRLKLAERDENGNVPIGTQMILKGGAAIIGALLVGLIASHGRKMTDFFLKGLGSQALDGESFAAAAKRKGSALMKGVAIYEGASGAYKVATSDNVYDKAMGATDILQSVAIFLGPWGQAAALVTEAMQMIIDYFHESDDDEDKPKDINQLGVTDESLKRGKLTKEEFDAYQKIEKITPKDGSLQELIRIKEEKEKLVNNLKGGYADGDKINFLKTKLSVDELEKRGAVVMQNRFAIEPKKEYDGIPNINFIINNTVDKKTGEINSVAEIFKNNGKKIEASPVINPYK